MSEGKGQPSYIPHVRRETSDQRRDSRPGKGRERQPRYNNPVVQWGSREGTAAGRERIGGVAGGRNHYFKLVRVGTNTIRNTTQLGHP